MFSFCIDVHLCWSSRSFALSRVKEVKIQRSIKCILFRRNFCSKHYISFFFLPIKSSTFHTCKTTSKIHLETNFNQKKKQLCNYFKNIYFNLELKSKISLILGLQIDDDVAQDITHD